MQVDEVLEDGIESDVNMKAKDNGAWSCHPKVCSLANLYPNKYSLYPNDITL